MFLNALVPFEPFGLFSNVQVPFELFAPFRKMALLSGLLLFLQQL